MAKATNVGPSLDQPIIPRKITPPALPDKLVNRPRLTCQLREAVRRSHFLMVTATAGAGKTTAVAQALAETPDLGVGWLTLDRTDAAPGRLLTYLQAAIGEVVPSARQVAASAVASGVSLVEAAGLLVAAIEDQHVVLVLDELERLGESSVAWELIENLLRYAPSNLRIVMISRRAIPSQQCAPPPMTRVAVIDDRDLAFDVDEARQALELLDAAHIDPAAAVADTGGWVAGILFEAWRSGDHVPGVGGESDPLHGYLSAHLIAGLPDALAEFLITTSVLPEVTIAKARALGVADAGARFAELRHVRIPAILDAAVPALRCHSRFREYLLHRLDERPDHQLRALRTRLARMYTAEGQHEDAVEEFIRAGALNEAVSSAERAVLPIIDRGDLSLAQAWLDMLGAHAALVSNMTIAELMLAIADDDFTRAIRILNTLEATESRDALAARSDRAAAMMAWCYLHQGMPDALDDVLRLAGRTPMVEAVRYASWMITNRGVNDPPHPPPLTGAPSDGLVLIADATLGRSGSLDAASVSEWVGLVAKPGRIASLRAMGRICEALDEYDETLESALDKPVLHIYIGPELLVDARKEDRARAAVEQGRRLAIASGSLGYQALNALAAAKLELRLARDPTAARKVLDTIATLIADREFRLINGVLDMWYGFALLLQNHDAEAVERLHRAVENMLSGHRLLELPAAAVYLSEAEWRLGNEDAADEAADLALETARSTGSDHTLLQALRDFPAVASRRIDSVASVDSPWHALGRILLQRDASVGLTTQHRKVEIHLHDHGNPVLLVDGREVQPRIAKSYELVAFLATRRPGRASRASRAAVLDALFERRYSDVSARTYLRQAVYHVRQVITNRSDLYMRDGMIGFRDAVVVDCDSARFEALLAEARRLHGSRRLEKTKAALALVDGGEYMAGANSSWIEDRRHHIATLCVDARFEAAELAFSQGHYHDAQALCDAVLTSDPCREPAWRLEMRICNSLGDDAGVINAYQQCANSLRQLGVYPAEGTKELLNQLRR